MGRPFGALLDAVMAVAAQGLPVVPVPEQRLVAPVRGDVIDHRRRSATQGAGGVQVQELGTGLFPLARIAALAAIRAGGIMAAAPGTGAGDLTGAGHACGHDLATGTQAGRVRHVTPRGGLAARQRRQGQNQGPDRRRYWLGAVRPCRCGSRA